MNVIQIGLMVVLLLVPFIGAKVILDLKKVNYLKKNMYLSVFKFIVLVIGLMILLAQFNFDEVIKSAIITYVVFAGTVYLGLIFQRTYFKHSEVLDEKVLEYQIKKRR
jgi:hypothetical protein